MSRKKGSRRQESHDPSSTEGRRRSREELIAVVERESRRVGTLATLHNAAIAELLGMHHTDQMCLDLLDWAEPLTAGQIASHLGLTTGAVTGLLDRLEAGGWVRRERDPDDRRRVLVWLEDLDDPKLWEAYRPLAEAIEAHRSMLSDDELEVVARFLEYANGALADATEHARELRRG